MRILFFGDSITQGFWAKDGGWVEQIRWHFDNKAIKDLNNNKQPSVFNVGISGDTTRELLKRIESETIARIWRDEPIIVMIAVGTNDDVFEADDPDEFKENLEKIVHIVEPLAQHVVLVGNPACDEALTTPVAWGDFSYTNKELKRSEKQIKQVADERKVHFVPIFDDFKAKLDAGSELLADGLHPNDSGHLLMANKVLPQLKELLK